MEQGIGVSSKEETFNIEKSAASDPLESFRYVLPVKTTQDDYVIRLGYFFDYLQIAGNNIEDKATRFLEQALLEQSSSSDNKNKNKWAYDCLIRYINYLKNDSKRNLSGSSISNYFAAIKLFYEANSINLNWKWISKGLPPSSRVANDRAPTTDELRRLVQYPDRRIRVIVYVMASSGIRVDAWNYLNLKISFQ